MHIGKYIDMVLYERNITKGMLADMIGINQFELKEKMKLNKLSAVELLKIAEVLNLDLNKIKKKI